jgi:hypothetical protein
MAEKGHEDAFPPTTLSNRSRLDKPTFAGTRNNEQDAPTAVVACRSFQSTRSTLSRRSVSGLTKVFGAEVRKYR